MRVLISIDDTDDIDSRGTGEIAELLGERITERGWGICGPVTRHQLLIHPDIPYTSHNSSMCFSAEIATAALEAVTEFCCLVLPEESAPTADPGLCIVVPERLENPEALMAFGRKAKTTVISKEAAYAAASTQQIHLSEHGGTGQGVIGALAGAGLRLTGSDGRFKGRHRIPSQNQTATVNEIRASGIDLVRTLEGKALGESETVRVEEWVKLVLMDGKAVLLVVPAEGAGGAAWQAVDRKIFKDY